MTMRMLSICPLFVAMLTGATGCGGGDDSGSGDGKGSPWVGHTYFAMPGAALSEPAGLITDTTFLDYVPNFLLKVNSASGDKVSLTMAPANEEGDQDTCTVTADVDATVSSYPSMETPAIDLDLFITNKTAGITVKATVKDLSFTDILPNGDTKSKAGRFEATLDGRDLYPLVTQLGDGADEKTLCDSLHSLLSPPVSCEACSDSEPYCLHLISTKFSANPVSSSVKKVTASSRSSSCPQPK